MDLLSPSRQVYNKDERSLHYLGQQVLSDEVDDVLHKNEISHNKPQQSNGSIKNMWKFKGKLSKNEYSDRIVNERRDMFCKMSSPSLFDKDLQLDLLEGSLLSEVGVQSIVDIQCPSTNFSITASSTIPKIPSHSKFLHLESNMLSPVQSNKILLPLSTDTSARRPISNGMNLNMSVPTEQDGEDIKTFKLVEDTPSVSLTYTDHDYCLNKVKCSKNRDENETTCNVSPLQSCTQLTRHYTKAFLTTVGLTNINLETLADTRSISLSLYEVKISGPTSRHEGRVKLRGKDFLKVMRSDKIRNKKLNNAYLEVTEMRCQLFDGNTSMRQIEFITDLLYCVRGLSDGVQHLLTGDPRYSIKKQDAEVTGFDEIRGGDEMKQECRNHRIHLTKRMASLSPTLKQESNKRKTYLCDNPPTVEASRSVSFINRKEDHFYEISKESLTSLTDDKSSFVSEDVEAKQSSDNHETDIQTRQLRSRKIKLNVHTSQKKSVDSIRQAEATQDAEVECSEHSWKYDEECIVNKPTEVLQEWLSVSDRWLREFLDVESMLQLI